MKKSITLYLSLFAALLVSCSENETIQSHDSALLKSYKISKDSQGRYSIDYNVNQSVVSEMSKNNRTKSNDIYLFSGSGFRSSFTKALSLENNTLKVGFLENNEKRSSIVIEDKDIVLGEGKENEEYLEEYSVEDLGNNNYKLDFRVKLGVKVDYTFNDSEQAYEVHLKMSDTKKVGRASFSKIYTKTSNLLKIDFVNHLKSSYQARSSSPKRPKFIVQNGTY